jgi:hypothetical protein
MICACSKNARKTNLIKRIYTGLSAYEMQDAKKEQSSKMSGAFGKKDMEKRGV